MGRFVYADNSATTQISDNVFQAMLPFLKEEYGNASSLYKIGRDSRIAIESAREQVAKVLGCEPREIHFTSCGSESDNWALKGTMERLGQKGKKHLITTAFEHHAILHTAQHLQRLGYDVTYLPVDKDGLIDPQQVKDAIREDTALVSIMYANNEIGTIEPIAEIGAICKEAGVLFHTDAVQAIGNLHINVREQNIDMLSLSAHKIHGPKGIGALYVRKGVVLPNLIDGGAQESGHRAGTENVAYIVGLGRAMEDAVSGIDCKVDKLTKFRDQIIEALTKIPYTRLNGHPTKRLCNNVNISFEGVEGEALLLLLDSMGIAASSGSACTSGSLDPSHVLLSIGLRHEVAHGSLRLSLSDFTTQEDVDYIIECVPKVIDRLRAMSPVWEDMMKAEKNSN